MRQREKFRDIDAKDLHGTELVETVQVKDGVECDVYKFAGDTSKDLAIVRVKSGYKTPLQRVVQGKQTIEGHIDGEGTLTVTTPEGEAATYEFTADERQEIVVEVGQTMQWHANGETDLTFYEVCTPPYREGRFEDLLEE